jgi:hypothetical protein
MAKLTETQKQKAKGLKSARVTEMRAAQGRATPKTNSSDMNKKDKKAPARLESSKPGNIFTKRKEMIKKTVDKAVKGK